MPLHHSHHHHHGGYSGPPVPWYFWAKNRNETGIYILSIGTLILMIIDIALAITRYVYEVGAFGVLIIELDIIFLILQGVNFASLFKKEWLMSGYYCQVTLAVLGFLIGLPFRFPIAFNIGMRIKDEQSDSLSDIALSKPAVDFMILGVITGMFCLIGLSVWNSLTSASIVQDREYVNYHMQYLRNLMAASPIIVLAGQMATPPTDQYKALQDQMNLLQAQMAAMAMTNANASIMATNGYNTGGPTLSHF